MSSTTTLPTIADSALAAVCGGAWKGRGQRSDQIAERKKWVCNSPTPEQARADYDYMYKNMTVDHDDSTPGVSENPVRAIADLCNFPFPNTQSAPPRPTRRPAP